MVAETRKLPVFIRWALLGILRQSCEATGEVRSMAVTRKLSVISEAAAHVKTLTATRGRVMAETRKLPVFIRQAPLNIRRRSCEATGEVRSMAVARKLPVISEATAHVKSLTGGSRTGMARKLPVISEAAAHAKTLTGGRMVAETRKLPVFIRWALLGILRQSCEATGEVRCMAVACKLSVISEAAAHVKTLTATRGRMMAETRKLPVFIRRASPDIGRQSCKATR